MYNSTLQPIKKAWLLVTAGLILASYTNHLYSQQDVINKKDVTRPETSRQFNSFNLTSFTAIQQNGFNEIKVPAAVKDNNKKILIEYSFDGVNFLTGPEVLENDKIFTYKHQLQDTRPILYRLRTEEATGTVSYSGAFLPKGLTIQPVQIQSNIVSGNVINATAQFPVERVGVVSAEGVQIFTKDVNGLRDFIPVAIPSLKKGVYLITFYGNGWNSTSRFMVS